MSSASANRGHKRRAGHMTTEPEMTEGMAWAAVQGWFSLTCIARDILTLSNYRHQNNQLKKRT